MEENKILFKNTSKMDGKEIENVQALKIKKMLWGTSIALFASFTAVGIGFYFWQTFLGIAMIVLGAFGSLWLYPYLVKSNLKKENESIFAGKKYLNHFEFYEEEIVVSSDVAREGQNEYEEKAKEKFLYSDITKVVAYKEYLFLYVTKYQSLILNQKGMTTGVVADLLELFKSKNIKVIQK